MTWTRMHSSSTLPLARGRLVLSAYVPSLGLPLPFINGAFCVATVYDEMQAPTPTVVSRIVTLYAYAFLISNTILHKMLLLSRRSPHEIRFREFASRMKNLHGVDSQKERMSARDTQIRDIWASDAMRSDVWGETGLLGSTRRDPEPPVQQEIPGAQTGVRPIQWASARVKWRSGIEFDGRWQMVTVGRRMLRLRERRTTKPHVLVARARFRESNSSGTEISVFWNSYILCYISMVILDRTPR
ncbi:hypothetical protein BD779DRAFT_1482609 [Infundibulicybe gibba]|nr:hypothetical protein BD779DRAFT_1482609 [Infundibulicybe gibba]